jgi:hypothetical protein
MRAPSDPITQKQMQMMRTPWNPESHAGNIVYFINARKKNHVNTIAGHARST